MKILCAVVSFLFAAVPESAHANDIPYIPSLRSISASTSGPLFIPYRPPNLNPYGPSMRSADPAPSAVAGEQPTDSGLSGIVAGPVLGKFVFDPVKDFVTRGSLQAGTYIFGSDFSEGFAKYIASLSDLFNQTVIGGELPSLWEFAGEFAAVGKFAGGLPLAVVTGFFSSNVAGAPEPGQERFYLDFSSTADPSSVYARSLYGTSGQFIAVNTQTPEDWAPLSGPPGPPSPPGPVDACFGCTQEDLCWCAVCFPEDSICSCDASDPTCWSSLLKRLAARKNIKKKIAPKAFTPVPSSRPAR
jgi:hypothetical protein